jgi:GntR family transcriptional regulator/MocR family aminotransferase
MSRRPFALPALILQLDPEDARPLYRQVYDEIRHAILTGRLRAGTRLPSTRTLARQLKLSRSTVLNAFELLLTEGYLQGEVGRGTYVTRDLPDDLLRVSHTEQADMSPGTTPPKLSHQGEDLRSTVSTEGLEKGLPSAFWPPLPALDHFPFGLWTRLISHRYRYPPHDLLVYGDPIGYRPLREAVADFLSSVRGVRCDAEQVIITTGSQQGIYVTAHLLLNPGDTVWVEEPCYPGTRGVLQLMGAQLVHVPVDEEGMDVAAGRASSPHARMACVTPSHQYPLGVTMSVTRRLELLEWARQTDAWILENDYNSFYRYVGQPLPALQGLDTAQRVIYLGTFSNVLFPSLRLGYLVVPTALVAVFRAARVLMDRQPPSIEQAALADFIAQGHLSRHLRRMRAIYSERQAVLVEATERELAGLLKVPATEAGMHAIGWASREGSELVSLAKAHGVNLCALSTYYKTPMAANSHGVLLGYTALSPAEIRRGVAQMARM